MTRRDIGFRPTARWWRDRKGGDRELRRSELVRLVGLQAGLYPAAADAAVKAVFEEVAGRAGAGRGGAACGVRVVRGEALPGAQRAAIHGPVHPSPCGRRARCRSGRQGAPGRGEPEDRLAGRGRGPQTLASWRRR